LRSLRRSLSALTYPALLWFLHVGRNCHHLIHRNLFSPVQAYFDRYIPSSHFDLWFGLKPEASPGDTVLSTITLEAYIVLLPFHQIGFRIAGCHERWWVPQSARSSPRRPYPNLLFPFLVLPLHRVYRLSDGSAPCPFSYHDRVRFPCESHCFLFQPVSFIELPLPLS